MNDNGLEWCSDCGQYTEKPHNNGQEKQDVKVCDKIEKIDINSIDSDGLEPELKLVMVDYLKKANDNLNDWIDGRVPLCAKQDLINERP